MRSVLPFDELNIFVATLRTRFPNGKLPKKREEFEDILDKMLDLFLLAYATGNEVVNESLQSDWQPTLDDVMETVDRKVAGKTWRERAEEYFESEGSVDDLVRIAETESHRDANEAAYKTAVFGGATEKTWVTMRDLRVREQHDFMEGQTVPIDAYFYAPDGSKAMYPGGFGVPEQDINCRCELIFT